MYVLNSSPLNNAYIVSMTVAKFASLIALLIISEFLHQMTKMVNKWTHHAYYWEEIL